MIEEDAQDIFTSAGISIMLFLNNLNDANYIIQYWKNLSDTHLHTSDNDFSEKFNWGTVNWVYTSSLYSHPVIGWLPYWVYLLFVCVCTLLYLHNIYSIVFNGIQYGYWICFSYSLHEIKSMLIIMPLFTIPILICDYRHTVIN